jgi:hypothetical protein
MVRRGRTVAGTGPHGRSGGPRRNRTTQAQVDGRDAPAATAAMPVTTLPPRRADEIRRSALTELRPLRRAGADVRRRGASLAAAIGVAGLGAGDGVPEVPLDPAARCGARANRVSRVVVYGRANDTPHETIRG